MNTFEMSSKKAKSFFMVAAMTLSAIQFACASEPAKKLPEKTSIPGKQIEKKLTGSQQKLLESLRTRWGKSPEEIMKFKPQDGRLQKVAHIDPSSITVSGLSSGGFMSTQLHVAFSDLFQGSAAIAGGPFDCSSQNTDVKTVKEQCMLGLASEKGYAYFYAQAVSLFSNGQIANLNNLKSKPVYIFNSADDQVIAPVLGFINNEFFTQLESKVTAEALLYPDSPGYLVAHGMANNNPYFGLFLSEEIGSVDPYTPCAPSGGQSTPWYLKLISRGADPWLYYCQYPDAITPLPVTPASTPEKILKTLYGSIKPMGTPKDSGFFTLEQLPYAQMVDPTIKTVQDLNARGLNQNAFAYVPEFCQNINNTCKLHVALHGCQQFTGWTIVPKVGSYFYKKGMLSFPFGNTFYYQSDFAAFAETNQMIVLFPQAWNIGTDASSVNPYGCWEFWPFTAADALNSVTRSGVQMGTIANMVKATTTQRFRH